MIINKESVCSNPKKNDGRECCGPTTKQTVISICVVRDLILGKSQVKPFYGNHQVIIVKDSHLLRKESIDQLLKILEEGSPNFLLIILVQSLDSLPLTIKSRCQTYKLFPLPSKNIENLLEMTYPEKNEDLSTIAKLSQGCFGKAVDIIENPIILDYQNQTIERILSLLGKPLSKQLEYSQKLSGQYKKNKDSVINELDCWSNWCRDILMIQTNQNHQIIYSKYLDETKKIASIIPISKTLNLLNYISSSKKTLNMNVNPLIIFDIFVKQIPKSIQINLN